MLKLSKFIKYRYFCQFWFFYFSRKKNISNYTLKAVFLVGACGFYSKYQSLVYNIRHVVGLLAKGRHCQFIFLCSNFIYNKSGLKKIKKILSLSSDVVFKDLLRIFTRDAFLFVCGGKYNQGVLVNLKSKKAIIVSLVDYDSCCGLVDYQLVVSIKNFFVVYFFIKFFTKILCLQ